MFVFLHVLNEYPLHHSFFFLEEGEKIPEVKCLATGLRKENLRFGPHGEVGSVDDAFDARPGFADTARSIQDACKGAKI